MKTGLFIKQFVGTLIFFSVIFISAGKFNYWQGLTYTGIGFVMMVLSFTLLRLDDDLLKERSKPGEGVKQWDKIILGLSFLSTIGMYLIAGLDSGRFLWSPEFSLFSYAMGILFTITGQLVFLVAQKQNRFFSSTVRIQTDRGHTVCQTGLYKIVRHPAYLGSFIQSLGFPFFFGSLWSFLPVLASIILLLVRTSLEDRTLINELQGYQDYVKKVPYKLLPLIW